LLKQRKPRVQELSEEEAMKNSHKGIFNKNNNNNNNKKQQREKYNNYRGNGVTKLKPQQTNVE